MANTRLVTTIFVEGKGPYFCVLDPDAPPTILDAEVIATGGFPSHEGTRLVDEQDVSHPTYYAELTNLPIGDLSLSLRRVAVAAAGTFDTTRRRIHGIIGRDVIEDSLVFGFDRDKGIAWLETQRAFKPPTDAHVISYTKGTRRTGGLVVRRLVSANINGTSYDLHLGLGDTLSQLRKQHWDKARVEPQSWSIKLVDEFGGHRDVSLVGLAKQTTIGDVTRQQIGFVEYADRRWDFGELEGTIGLDFFRPFSVIADWHNERYFLVPRNDSEIAAAHRFGRWGTLLPECESRGCMTVQVSEQGSQLIARVDRDPKAVGQPIEALFKATRADGFELPQLYVSLPTEVDTW